MTSNKSNRDSDEVDEDLKPADLAYKVLLSVAWLIGIGQGLRCRHPENRSNPDLKHQGFAPLVPSRFYVSGLFER